jgi:hypothetical protein
VVEIALAVAIGVGAAAAVQMALNIPPWVFLLFVLPRWWRQDGLLPRR